MSKIGVTWRMMRSSSSRWTRRSTSSSVDLGQLGDARVRAAASSGKLPCIRLSSRLSSSSSGTAAPSLRERTFGCATVAEPLGHVLCVVGDHDVGAGAADRR